MKPKKKKKVAVDQPVVDKGHTHHTGAITSHYTKDMWIPSTNELHRLCWILDEGVGYRRLYYKDYLPGFPSRSNSIWELPLQDPACTPYHRWCIECTSTWQGVFSRRAHLCYGLYRQLQRRKAGMWCWIRAHNWHCIVRRVKGVFDGVENAGKTQKLWMQYHKHVCIIKDFIRAERLSDFKLHLVTPAKMLPTLAAAGHGQYAKAIRLTSKPSSTAESTILWNIALTNGEVFGLIWVSNRHWCVLLNQ